MNNIEIQYHRTPHTEFILGSYQEALCLLDFRYRKMRQTVDSRLRRGLSAAFIEKDNPLLRQTREQLDEYLGGERKKFDLPLKMVGSDFQQSVWNALMEIPFGETASYLDLAKTINHERAVRAVANANGANAISIIIPCHRIIGSNGELVGYGGGLPMKKKLLDLEKSRHSNLAFDF